MRLIVWIGVVADAKRGKGGRRNVRKLIVWKIYRMCSSIGLIKCDVENQLVGYKESRVNVF